MATNPTQDKDGKYPASAPEKNGPQGMSPDDFPKDTDSALAGDLDELKTDRDGVTSGTPDNDVGRGGRPSETDEPGPAGTPGKEPDVERGLPKIDSGRSA